jgi:hypothetical protein
MANSDDRVSVRWPAPVLFFWLSLQKSSDRFAEAIAYPKLY